MSAKTAALPTGIRANRQPCWHLITENGQPYTGPDDVPHFDSADQARSAVTQYAAATGPLTFAQLDEPCWLAVAHCGYVLDEEGATQMHHESGQEALEAAIDSGFSLLPAGTLACSPDCDECEPGTA